jgi:hypothetical protein
MAGQVNPCSKHVSLVHRPVWRKPADLGSGGCSMRSDAHNFMNPTPQLSMCVGTSSKAKGLGHDA